MKKSWLSSIGIVLVMNIISCSKTPMSTPSPTLNEAACVSSAMNATIGSLVDAPCQEFAIFVDGQSGDDTNDGSQKNPQKTFLSAIGNAKNKGKSIIYAAVGAYPE